MIVKIIKTEKILGKDHIIPVYIPTGSLVTKKVKESADKLYKELSDAVSRINVSYDKLEKSLKTNSLKKWKWLGAEIDKVLLSLENLSEADKDNNVIWVAFAQHLRDELRAGIDTRRAGTPKDHYRKCWLLYTTPHTEWIRTWVAWDAFVDRGEQLTKDERIMKFLSSKFLNLSIELDTKNYQEIAKIITEKVPSSHGAIDVVQLSNNSLDKLLDEVYNEFWLKKQQNGKKEENKS